MAKLKLYGIARSRAMRSLWAVHEVGVDYEQVPISFTESGSSADFLAVNPMGAIPALEDGDFKLSESLAINMYLAKKYGGTGPTPLYPSSLEGEAQTWSWSLWAATWMEEPVMTALRHRALLPEGERDKAAGDTAEHKLRRPLKRLDTALADRDYLLGSHFTVADLNVAAILLFIKAAGVDFGPFPRAAAWLGRCLARPALKAAKQAAT